MEKKILDAQEREKDRCLEVEKLRNLDQEREVERTRLTLAAEGRLGRPSTQSGLAGMVKFLPKFNVREPDVFFSLFEHVADDLNWGDEERTLLLQTVLVGRGQKAFVALPSAERKVYTCVKDAVLRSYEFIPQAYRQRFRSWKKADRQTYGELARDLTSSFTRWLTAEGVDTFDTLRDLMILEQFKNTLSDRIATYIHEHKVKTAAEAAVLADGFSLTHTYSSREFTPRYDLTWRERRPSRFNAGPPGRFDPVTSVNRNISQEFNAESTCNYCTEPGHWKINCPILAERNKMKGDGCKVGLCSFSSPVASPRVTQSKVKPLDREKCTVSGDKDLENMI